MTIESAIRSTDDKIPWSHLILPWEIGRHLRKHGELIRQFTVRDVLGRYRGSYLGIGWSLLRPLFMLAVYTVVFGYIFESRLGNRPNETRLDFALALFCGLIVFDFIAECVSRAPTLVLSNVSYVTKVVFPLEILPVSAVAAALGHLAISMLPLFLGLLLANGVIHLTVIYLPLLLLAALFLSLGLSWFLASLGVFIRDINSVIPVLLLVLMYASAIFYPISKVPPRLWVLVHLNPLALLVDEARNIVVWGTPLNWVRYASLLAVGIVVMILGYAFFMRTKQGFADVM